MVSVPCWVANQAVLLDALGVIRRSNGHYKFSNLFTTSTLISVNITVRWRSASNVTHRLKRIAHNFSMSHLSIISSFLFYLYLCCFPFFRAHNTQDKKYTFGLPINNRHLKITVPISATSHSHTNILCVQSKILV